MLSYIKSKIESNDGESVLTEDEIESTTAVSVWG